MCGIVGYVGQRAVQEILLAGLEKLEYRGYDSAGVSVLADGEIASVRAVGNLSKLREAVVHSNGGPPDADAAAGRRRSRAPRRPASATRAGRPTAASPSATPTRTSTRPTASTSSSTASSRTTSR